MIFRIIIFSINFNNSICSKIKINCFIKNIIVLLIEVKFPIVNVLL